MSPSPSAVSYSLTEDAFRSEIAAATYARQGALQSIVASANDPESVLKVAGELEGAVAVSTGLHRLGKLGRGRAELLDDPRFAALLQRFRMVLPLCGARQISNALHGLGTLEFRQGGTTLDMASIQTQRRIEDFEPQHLSNTLWACARMRYRRESMLQALVGRAIEDIRKLRPVDFSIITWACAILKYREVEWLRSVVRVRPNFDKFSPQNIANFAWGMATLGFRNENMFLALGREAVNHLMSFKPQELSNYMWALATVEVADKVVLTAVSAELEKRWKKGELHDWDPQSVANILWAYATLAIRDERVLHCLVDASQNRLEHFDCQNLANSTWALAMLLFRKSSWLDRVAGQLVAKIRQCEPLHLAQVAWAFSRFCHPATSSGFFQALGVEIARRCDDFSPQSLLDVYDAILYFGIPEVCRSVHKRISMICSSIAKVVEAFASDVASHGLATTEEAAAYVSVVEEHDVNTLGYHQSESWLRQHKLLADPDDNFVSEARQKIDTWRASQAPGDNGNRNPFHRSQCVWRLSAHQSDESAGHGDTVALDEGLFESGPAVNPTDRHGLIPCRLRHQRAGDAEFRALCAAIPTMRLHVQQRPLMLQLHLSEVPCLSCCGAMMQFHARHPGTLKVSFDRGRELASDTATTDFMGTTIEGIRSQLSQDSVTDPRIDKGDVRAEPRDRAPHAGNVSDEDCLPSVLDGSFAFSGDGATSFYRGQLALRPRGMPIKFFAPFLQAGVPRGIDSKGNGYTYYVTSRPTFLGPRDYEAYGDGP